MERTPEAVTQRTQIREVDQLLRDTEAVIVRAEDSLHRLAELAVERPSCRVLSVVAEDRRLIGVIPVQDLIDDIFLKIVPEEFLGEITGLEAALQYAGHVRVRTAGEIMGEPVSVDLTETVRDAFRRMHESRLNGLPVVDDQGRVTSYVDQLELLLVWLTATGREPLLRPEHAE